MFKPLTLLPLWSLAGFARICPDIEFSGGSWLGSAGRCLVFRGFLLFMCWRLGGGRGCWLEIIYIVIVHRYLEPPVSRVGVFLPSFTLQLLFSRSWLELQSWWSDAVGRCGHLIGRGLSHGNIGLGFCIIQQSELQLLTGWFGRLVFPRYYNMSASPHARSVEKGGNCFLSTICTFRVLL